MKEMRYKHFLVGVLLALFFLPIYAQKSKVTAGSLELNNQNYERAIQYLREALNKPDLLDAKTTVKANVKLLQAYIYYYAKERDKALEKYPTLVEEAFQCYKTASSPSNSKYFTRYREEVNAVLPTLGQLLYLEAFNAFQKEDYATALQLVNNAKQIFGKGKIPDFYGIHSLEGYIYLQQGDTEKAIPSLEKAIAIYKKNPPQQKDKTVAYLYGKLAEIYADKGNKEKAIYYLNEGRETFPQDQNLINIETQIYLRPEFYNEALAKYEKLAAEKPDDEMAQLIYAQLLEKSDINQALTQYQKVLRLNPNNLIANYNIGAIYVNKAAEASQKLKQIQGDKQLFEQTKAEMLSYFEKALPYMEKAYQLEPESRTTLSTLTALIQITTYLDMQEKADFYRKKKQELQKKFGS